MMPQTHEHLRPRLGDLYESDCFSDTFECAVSGASTNFATGSYSSEFHILMVCTAAVLCGERA
jgi:hypothetical protein